MFGPSAKTAMKRTGVSAPVKRLIESGMFWGSVCNWGSGFADHDSHAMLVADGVTEVTVYDPQFDMPQPEDQFDVIYCGYVLNTLPPAERDQCVVDVLSHLKKDGQSVAIFAVRADKVDGEPSSDGVMTKKGTFQKTFTADELKEYLNTFGHADAQSVGHYVIGMVISDA